MPKPIRDTGSHPHCEQPTFHDRVCVPLSLMPLSELQEHVTDSYEKSQLFRGYAAIQGESISSTLCSLSITRKTTRGTVRGGLMGEVAPSDRVTRSDCSGCCSSCIFLSLHFGPRLPHLQLVLLAEIVKLLFDHLF
jgi:hypothetical protein